MAQQNEFTSSTFNNKYWKESIAFLKNIGFSELDCCLQTMSEEDFFADNSISEQTKEYARELLKYEEIEKKSIDKYDKQLFGLDKALLQFLFEMSFAKDMEKLVGG